MQNFQGTIFIRIKTYREFRIYISLPCQLLSRDKVTSSIVRRKKKKSKIKTGSPFQKYYFHINKPSVLKQYYSIGSLYSAGSLITAFYDIKVIDPYRCSKNRQCKANLQMGF